MTKKSRRIGADFELEVRAVLEKEGYIVDKWHNQVNLTTGKIEIAKNLFGFGRALMLGSGFPDFIAFKPIENVVIGVEAKLNRKLKPIEKEKMALYKKNKVFDSLWVAYRGENNDVLFSEVIDETYKRPTGV